MKLQGEDDHDFDIYPMTLQNQSITSTTSSISLNFLDNLFIAQYFPVNISIQPLTFDDNNFDNFYRQDRMGGRLLTN